MRHPGKPGSPVPSGDNASGRAGRGDKAVRQTGGRVTHDDYTSKRGTSGAKPVTSPALSGASVTRLFRDSRTGELAARADTGIITSLRAAGFSTAEITRLVVSKRSLERRQEKNEPLSASETDRALRIERIQEHAVRVFCSEEKANRWLRKPCRALDGAIPLELMVSETGAHLVDMELHAIDHGMFA